MSGVIKAEAGKCKLSTLGREIVDPQKGEKRPALVHADMTGKVFKKCRPKGALALTVSISGPVLMRPCASCLSALERASPPCLLQSFRGP
jgi:hypothetical protein